MTHFLHNYIALLLKVQSAFTSRKPITIPRSVVEFYRPSRRPSPPGPVRNATYPGFTTWPSTWLPRPLRGAGRWRGLAFGDAEIYPPLEDAFAGSPTLGNHRRL